MQHDLEKALEDNEVIYKKISLLEAKINEFENVKEAEKAGNKILVEQITNENQNF